MDSKTCDKIFKNISRVVVGKERTIELLLVALIAEGHILLEDVPGVAKTLMAKCLAKSIGGTFNRIQFTPDLMPADITGFNVWDQNKAAFSFHPGPVISHVLLADEINRTIPRTQSSLLEGMEERQLTVDGKTYALPDPFFVIATQNPIELEGTFPLPEAQLDRFLLKIHLGYPKREEEIRIMEQFQEKDPFEEMAAVATPEEMLGLRKKRRSIRVSKPIKEYITDIVRATRHHATVEFGASPRGSLGLMRAGQAQALVRGREFVLPDDIKSLTIPVLGHRLVLKQRERLRGEESRTLLESILEEIPVPSAQG
ncbi:MAG: MoxR family ATPase [Thermodesulfobacteriota bacterium]